MTESQNSKSVLHIDGENLMHFIADVLIGNGLITHRRDVAAVDFRHLINGIIRDKDLSARFYAAKAKMVNITPALKTKTADIVSSQRKLRQVLREQDIDFINSGQLAIRKDNSSTARRNQKWYLKEKGVDVRIAVDMVQQSRVFSTIYLASSDTDLLPAIKATRANGCKVVYVSSENRSIKAIRDNADKTLEIKDSEIIESFKRLSA